MLWERTHTSSLVSKTGAQPSASTSFPQVLGFEKRRFAALLAANQHLYQVQREINGDTDSMSDQESERRTKLLKTKTSL